MWKYLLFTFLGISISQCKTVQITNPSEFQGKKISFGNGGGFAGTYKEYVLCENGQLFYRTNSKSSFAELDKVEKKRASQSFLNYKQMFFIDLEINDPGNLYYFLKYSEEDMEQKLMWGGMNAEVPSALKVYYTNLMDTVKNKNPIK